MTCPVSADYDKPPGGDGKSLTDLLRSALSTFSFSIPHHHSSEIKIERNLRKISVVHSIYDAAPRPEELPRNIKRPDRTRNASHADS